MSGTCVAVQSTCHTSNRLKEKESLKMHVCMPSLLKAYSCMLSASQLMQLERSLMRFT